MSEQSDSDRMPLDVHVRTVGERRDAQIRVLEQLCELLTKQMAELAMGQEAGDKKRAELSDQLAKLDKKLAENNAVTAEVLEVMSAARMGFKVLGWVGACVKWGGGLVAAVMAIWVFWHAVKTGSPFPPSEK